MAGNYPTFLDGAMSVINFETQQSQRLAATAHEQAATQALQQTMAQNAAMAPFKTQYMQAEAQHMQAETSKIKEELRQAASLRKATEQWAMSKAQQTMQPNSVEDTDHSQKLFDLGDFLISTGNLAAAEKAYGSAAAVGRYTLAARTEVIRAHMAQVDEDYKMGRLSEEQHRTVIQALNGQSLRNYRVEELKNKGALLTIQQERASNDTTRTNAVVKHLGVLDNKPANLLPSNTAVKAASSFIGTRHDMTDEEKTVLGTILASKAADIAKDHQGLSYEEALKQAYGEMVKRGEFKGLPTMRNGHNPDTALPLPTSRDQMMNGQWYNTPKGPLYKQGNQMFTPREMNMKELENQAGALEQGAIDQADQSTEDAAIMRAIMDDSGSDVKDKSPDYGD